MSTVLPAMQFGGNIAATTSATGASYVTFAAQPCKQLILVNATGTDIEFRQAGAGVAVPVINGTAFPIYGLHDCSEIGVRRVDQSNTQVSLKARWED